LYCDGALYAFVTPRKNIFKLIMMKRHHSARNLLWHFFFFFVLYLLQVRVSAILNEKH
jgi:hypothetical protein